MSKDYYISAKGNDQNEGTSPDRAFRSIHRINQLSLKPSDQILFEGGTTFEGNLVFENYKHSLEKSPVLISTYGSGKAHINAGKGNGIYILNSGGFHIKNLIITGEGRKKNPNHGILFYIQSKLTKRLENVSISHLDVSGFNKGGITFYADEKYTDLGFQNIQITHSITQYNGDHGIAFSGNVIRPNPNKNIYIGHSQAFNNYGELGKVHSHTGNGIVVGNSENVLIEYCEAYENGRDNFFNGGGPVGIWLWDCFSGKIRFSESHHNRTGSKVDGGGFDLDGGCHNCSLEHNFSHHNDGAGYLIAEYDGAKPLRENTIRQNISVNDGLKNNYGGIFLWRGNGIIENLNIYENLIFSSQSSTGFKVVSDSIKNVKLINNIFITDGEADLVNISDSVSDFLILKNHFLSLSGKYTYKDEGKSFSNINSWIKAGKLIQTSGTEAADFLKGIDWESNLENVSFWRSVRTLITEFSDPDIEETLYSKKIDWKKLFEQPKPQFVPPPLIFDIKASQTGFSISSEIDPQIDKVILELWRDFETDFTTVKQFSSPKGKIHYTHFNPYSGINYYRLKLQIGEEAYTYSPVYVSPEFTFSQKIKVNYAQGTIKINPEKLQFNHLEITDLNGKFIQGLQTNGDSLFSLEKPLKTGVYFLKLSSSIKGETHYKKILVD